MTIKKGNIIKLTKTKKIKFENHESFAKSCSRCIFSLGDPMNHCSKRSFRIMDNKNCFEGYYVLVK